MEHQRFVQPLVRRSSKIRSAKVFKTIDDVDTKILGSIELCMRRFEFVPLDVLLKATRLPANDLDFRLSRLVKKELVKRRVASYTGLAITEVGYDCLAFRSLVKQNVLEAIGPPVGVGKECTCLQE
jgi:RIO kinase 2